MKANKALFGTVRPRANGLLQVRSNPNIGALSPSQAIPQNSKGADYVIKSMQRFW
jgi:hypothetical protein